MWATFVVRVLAIWRRIWFRELEPAEIPAPDLVPALDAAPCVELPQIDLPESADPSSVEAPPLSARWSAPDPEAHTTTRGRAKNRYGDEVDLDDLHWHFRRDILDRLDEYFVCIRRLRRHDPASYQMFARLGFSIMPHIFAEPKVLTPDELVGFGGILMITRDTFKGAERRSMEGHFFPTFAYFQKVRHPSRVERFNGQVYEFVMLYDDHANLQLQRCGIRKSVPFRCHIGVDASGHTHLLRTMCVRHSRIRVKRGRRREQLTLTTQCLAVPFWAEALGADNHGGNTEWVCDMFRLVVYSYLATHKRIIIRVKDRACTAAFGIDAKRASYFFRDRDNTEVAVDGKRKRIFHSVVEHMRKLSEERTTTVKSHYRGIRKFTWQSYGVHIVMPGNNYLTECPAAGIYAEDIAAKDRREEMLDPGQVGAKLDAALLV